MNDRIEVSFNVQTTATVAVWVDREEWATMSEADREAVAMNACNDVQHAMDSSGFYASDANLYVSIISPDLTSLGVYDPDA